MSSLAHAKAGYGTTRQATQSPREIEYALFSQVTSNLTAAQDGEFSDLVAALDHNRRVWTEIAILVADKSNALGESLRGQLFYLYEFTAQHTSKVLRKECDATPLIEINRAIMAGLAGQKEGA